MERNASLKNNVKRFIGKAGLALMTVQATVLSGASAITSHAMNLEQVSVNTTNMNDPFAGIGKIIGLILRVMQYVGVAMVLYGVYEIVMGMTAEGQAEKKTKGVIMAAAGIIMAAMKAVLNAAGLI